MSDAWSAFEDGLGLNRRRVPFSGSIETTFRCNLNCVHCYVSAPAADRGARLRELRTREWQRIIDEIADAGTLFLLFTGGETLLRPDFERLYAHAVKRGLLVTVFTNGTLVTDRVLGLFDELRPEAVEITLYGRTAETHDRVTRTPGSHGLCLRSIDRLLEHEAPLRLKTMALASNRHEVGAMRELARALGVRFRVDGQLNPRIDGQSADIADQQIPVEEVWALDQQDAEELAGLRRFCEQHAAAAPDAARTHVFSCGAGQSAFAIDPYGSLLLCPLARRSGFDLRRGAFSEGWNDHLPRWRARLYAHNTSCPTCELASLCGNCAGAAELETGDAEGIVPAFCSLAHLRARSLLGERCRHDADASCCLPGEPPARPAADAAARAARE